ncbi:MAG TPA: cobalamin B12-binding domain-containing protein [Ignavibacteriaceae bacterium]|jgi:methanogenic corrinoid protein MtbC1|nr:cobalamin B12-binding domain-containing protein [Ignavibacteriaceae bacterium]
MIREVYYLDYFNGLLEGDKSRCREVVDKLFQEKTGIIEIYTGLFQKSLYQVGKMWDQNKLSIGDEHLGTQITEELLYYCSSKIVPGRHTGKKALVSCINKEHHKLGARMAADVFVINGWETYFLGASTPTKEILKYVDLKKPDIVGLSFSFYINVIKLLDVVREIKSNFPSQKIVLGGRAELNGHAEILTKFENVFYINTVTSLNDFLQRESAV